MAMTPLSRTIGTDQLVDEMVINFTHSVEIDWMLPGIAPTGRRVEVALVVVVRFRDGKLAHEHIYWDQASVLAQLGLIDPNRLPVAGAAFRPCPAGPCARAVSAMPSLPHGSDIGRPNVPRHPPSARATRVPFRPWRACQTELHRRAASLRVPGSLEPAGERPFAGRSPSRRARWPLRRRAR